MGLLRQDFLNKRQREALWLLALGAYCWLFLGSWFARLDLRLLVAGTFRRFGSLALIPHMGGSAGGTSRCQAHQGLTPRVFWSLLLEAGPTLVRVSCWSLAFGTLWSSAAQHMGPGRLRGDWEQRTDKEMGNFWLWFWLVIFWGAREVLDLEEDKGSEQECSQVPP